MAQEVGITRRAYNSGSAMPVCTGRALLLRIFLRTVMGMLALAAVSFGLDYAVFRIRAATNHGAYGSVVVTHYDAVLLKNAKTEFIFDPPGPERCVNALFPHAGMQPCWYLRRHPEQRTDI